MPSVNSKNMPFERALRIFRKKCMNAGIVQEVRKREAAIAREIIDKSLEDLSGKYAKRILRKT